MGKTILVTGGTGYVGSWIVKDLLEKNYTVRLTVRNKSKIEKFSHLEKIAQTSKGKLEIWEADLLQPNAFNDVANGADAIMHVASPFTLNFKDPQKDLVDPAVIGTQNVLHAANQSGTVKKVVLTSSVAAVHGDNIDMQKLKIKEFTEEHFNFSSSVRHQPYSFSKVAAEKKAWEIFKNQNQWHLVVINPSFVLGPSLTNTSNSESLKIMNDLLSGKLFFGAPELYFGFVDVRDVANAHTLALENDNAEGRHILVGKVASVFDLGQIVKKLFGNRFKTPMMITPKPMLYLVGWIFGLTPKFIKNNVGYRIQFNTQKSTNSLGIQYTPLEKTVEDMINQMKK